MNNSLSKHVDNLLTLIPSGRYSAKQLQKLYENAISHNEDGKISEEQLEALIEAIELQMRIVDPRVANKILGPANRHSREFLENYLADLLGRFDFSQNKHRTAVKTGGGVIAGTEVCDDYISYRHPTSKMIAALNFGKTRHEDLLNFQVVMYQAGAWGQSDTHKFFSENDFESAKTLYEEYLQRVIDGESV